MAVTPDRSTDTGPSWVKSVFIWNRIYSASRARPEARIGWKSGVGLGKDDPLDRLGEHLFEEWLPGTQRHSLAVYLFCGFGLGADGLLRAAVEAERSFNPADFDSDGYYVGGRPEPNGGPA